MSERRTNVARKERRKGKGKERQTQDKCVRKKGLYVGKISFIL